MKLRLLGYLLAGEWAMMLVALCILLAAFWLGWRRRSGRGHDSGAV